MNQTKTINNSTKPHQHAGFTLIELLVTITILAVLTALAAPSFSRQIAESQRSNAINAISKGYSLARSSAIKSSRPVNLCISTDQATCASGAGGDWSKGWIIYSDVNADGGFTSGTDTLLQTQIPLKGLIAALSTATTPSSSFSFLPNGLLKGGADTIAVKPQNTAVAIKYLKLNNLGRLTISDSAS